MMGQMHGATMPVGVVLSSSSEPINAHGEGPFALLLVDTDGVVLGHLGPYPEEDVIAVWRDVASRSGLVRMIVHDDGALIAISRQIGRLALGITHTRRHSVLDGRRPRFLTQRQSGTYTLRPGTSSPGAP